MKTSYDPATDSLYIHLLARASANSVELTDGLIVDYDVESVAVGIDMQRVSQTTGHKARKRSAATLRIWTRCTSA